MADALALLLKQLLSDIMSFMRFHRKPWHRFPSNIFSNGPSSLEEALDSESKIAGSFDGLMNHLRDMMLGYENEEVQGLMKKMEEVASISAWHGREESMRDMMLETCEKLCNIRYHSNVEGEEVVVGFDDEVETLLDQLTGTAIKQLQVISIAGMAGLGKTTLARTLYRDPLIEYMFDIRAWTCVSQVYLKKDLLLGILSAFINDLTDETYKMRDEQLGEKLYKLLKGRKYLVVLDDIWDCMAWNNLKMYFPDDRTGSRVLFTSRYLDVSLNVQAARPAHVLRHRTEDESWDIFQKKVFKTGICPGRLEEFGRVITRKCEGLPLAIVIAAGLLKHTWSSDWWAHIAASLRSVMVRDPGQYMDSLALSYDHLPPHLRPCFLFLGVFREDYDIPVKKLIWLWVAQGFIHQTGSRILENVAGDFLMELIKRSLLMASRKRADGQIKACRMHDLVHDLCLTKAEKKIPPFNYRIEHISPLTAADVDDAAFVDALADSKLLQVGRSIYIDAYKSLRILDVESIHISLFPSEVAQAAQLVSLRYLAIQAHDGSPQASISNLGNLQMLIISSRKNIVVPKTIWNMVNLRHLYIKSGENLIEEPLFVQVTEKDGCPSALASLQTLSLVSPRSCQNIFSRTPNLRKLGFCGPLISRLGDLQFANIGSLPHLQKLKLLNTIRYPEASRSCNPIMFPESLKKLTLSNTGMDWEEIRTFAWLPNLEVLKLKCHACIGERWETSDAEFRKLRVLKLHDLGLRQWVSSSHNFPRLRRLVVFRCFNLNSIPSGLGKILTLEAIEVSWCHNSAHVSALEIQKEQESEGNCFLKVRSNRPSRKL